MVATSLVFGTILFALRKQCDFWWEKIVSLARVLADCFSSISDIKICITANTHGKTEVSHVGLHHPREDRSNQVVAMETSQKIRCFALIDFRGILVFFSGEGWPQLRTSTLLYAFRFMVCFPDSLPTKTGKNV